MRKILMLVLIGVMVFSLMACAPGGEDSVVGSTTEGSIDGFPDTGKYVYIARGLSDPFAALNAQACEATFLAAHPNWTFTIADADNDAGKLLQIIEDATVQGVDVIANGGVAGADATAAVKAAQNAGIFVFGVEVPVSETEDNVAPYVCVDFYHTYKVLMDYAVGDIPQNAKAVVLSGIEGFGPCIQREKALNEMLEQRPDIEIMEYQYANYNTDEAMAIMEDWLQKHDDIEAVISLTDTMAIGAIEAYRSSGIDCTDVWICGVDSLLDACSYIESGELTVSIFRPPLAYAEAELDLVERYYLGKLTDPAERVVIEPEIIVTKENVAEIRAAQE